MRAIKTAALSSLLLIAACNKSGNEDTRPVDTTLNDDVAATATPTPEPSPSASPDLSMPMDDYSEQGDQGSRPSQSYSEYGSGGYEDDSGDDVGSPVKDAVLIGSPSDWISADDYPPSAARAGEHGRVTMAWTINPQGRVENCHVTASSGSDILDVTSCRLVTQRARYRPATDASGNPVESSASRSINWTLPE